MDAGIVPCVGFGPLISRDTKCGVGAVVHCVENEPALPQEGNHDQPLLIDLPRARCGRPFSAPVCDYPSFCDSAPDNRDFEGVQGACVDPTLTTRQGGWPYRHRTHPHIDVDLIRIGGSQLRTESKGDRVRGVDVNRFPLGAKVQ